jgi:bla regulator protein blaR1
VKLLRAACLVIAFRLLALAIATGQPRTFAIPQSEETKESKEPAAPPPEKADDSKSKPVYVDPKVEAKNLIDHPKPEYPPAAKATRVKGTVKFHAIIDKEGTVESLKLKGGPLLLVDAALNAVQKWRYRPYLVNGEPVEVETEIDVVFSLVPCPNSDDVCVEAKDDRTPPRPEFMPEPPYTAGARAARVQGSVRLSIMIESDGSVDDVHLLKGLNKGLDENAVETVKTWKFHPATKDGKPVSMRVIVEITFRL